MTIHVVTGPPATGKTLNKHLIQRFTKTNRIIDGWYPEYPGRKPRDGDLVLTNFGEDVVRAAFPNASIKHISLYAKVPGFIKPVPAGKLGTPA